MPNSFTRKLCMTSTICGTEQVRTDQWLLVPPDRIILAASGPALYKLSHKLGQLVRFLSCFFQLLRHTNPLPARKRLRSRPSHPRHPRRHPRPHQRPFHSWTSPTAWRTRSCMVIAGETKASPHWLKSTPLLSPLLYPAQHVSVKTSARACTLKSTV